jgi:Ca2+-binding RTX toxin-like protein
MALGNLLTIEQTIFHANTEDGFDIEGTNNQAIVNNSIFTENSRAGLLVQDEPSTSTSTVIVNNGTFSGNGSAGILDGNGSVGIFVGDPEGVHSVISPVVVENASGGDRFLAGGGDDELSSRSGMDHLEGRGGNDKLDGNGGDDFLDGGAGDDTLHGDADLDTLSGGEGNDRLFGDAGDDNLDGGIGSDIYFGGANRDTFVWSPIAPGPADAVTIDTIQDFEIRFGAALSAGDRLVIDVEDPAATESLLLGTNGQFDIEEGTAVSQQGNDVVVRLMDSFLVVDDVIDTPNFALVVGQDFFLV